MTRTSILVSLFALAAGCAHVEYIGQSAPAKPGPVQVVDQAATQPHRTLGKIVVEKVIGENLEMMLARLGQEGGRRGCDVVVCNVNHTIVDGVTAGEPTGVRYFSTASGSRVPDEVVGECDALR